MKTVIFGRGRRCTVGVLGSSLISFAVGSCAAPAPKSFVYIDDHSELTPYVVRTKSAELSNASTAPESVSEIKSNENP